MIRTKDKIYAETISPNATFVKDDLLVGKYVISDGNRTIKSFNPGPKRIMITDASGNASSFNHNLPNKLIGTDAFGKLELIPQIPIAPPTGRVLIFDTNDPKYLAVGLDQATIQLEPNCWYEVEVIGAGGGGGGGVGRYHIGAGLAGDALDGQPGGSGAYIKTTFKLSVLTEAIFRIGKGGSGGGAVSWYWSNGLPVPFPHILSGAANNGGMGGNGPFIPVASPVEPNDGLDPTYAFTGSLSPLIKQGAVGVNGGANGGDSEVTLGTIGSGETPSSTQGVGASGGGANGPYGGNGGKSKYTNNVGLSKCASGGGGGAGGGLSQAGDGGGIGLLSGQHPIGHLGAAGGSGVANGSDYTLSSGGGGGGSSSIFQWGNNYIIAGGGGGGAGAGFGGTNESTPGEPGTSNEEGYSEANNGGHAGEGCNLYDVTVANNTWQTSRRCAGGMGGKGIIRLWRCE